MTCRFTGTLNDKLRGFYRSTYTDDAGETHTIATTQLESVDARRAFPCWDEPDRKAVFEVTLTIDRDDDAFSNSPIVDVRRVGDKSVVRFAPTMKMSTYLVAFVVGQLETTETIDVDGVPLRVVFTPGKRKLADFGLAIGAFSLRFFTEYFGIPYPGDKVDLVAIPDFAAGAMENLGCITFRDTALLIDPTSAARAELERVADVVAHEMAHMWFGDLVTMGWWEGIWLNEAFATFMEMLCVDAFRPSWDRWVGFAPSREAALTIDGVHATRPIEYPVGPPKEAEGMFDLLTYEKGAAVLADVGAVHRARGLPRRRAHLSDGARLRQHRDHRPVGRARRGQRRTGARRHEHVHPPGWPSSGLTRTATPWSSNRSPTARSPTGIESAIGDAWNVPVAVRALAVDGKPGAPTQQVRPRQGTRSSSKRQRKAWPSSMPVDGACSGWATTPNTAWRWPARLSELTPLERANLLADTWATTLAGHSTLQEFLIVGAKLGLEPDPTPWAPVSAAFHLARRIVARGRPPVAARGRRRPRRPAIPAPRFRVPARRRGSHADAPFAGHQPLGYRRRGPRGARGSTAALRSSRRLGGGTGDPIPADVEAATLAVVAQLLRPGDYDALLQRYRTATTPQEEMRSLNALSAFPERRPGRAHIRSRHDGGAQPERLARHLFVAGQSGCRAGRSGSASPRHGTPSSSGSRRTRTRALPRPFPPCAATPTSPARWCNSWPTILWRRAPAASPNRWNA